MPRATITIDRDRLLPPEDGTLAIESVEEYPAACLALRAALHNGCELRLTVHNSTAAAWLTGLATTYGEERILVRRYTPRDALRDRWRIEIPATVTDRDILQANLLDEKIYAREGQSFSDA